jgi:hypothetical protein
MNDHADEFVGIHLHVGGDAYEIPWTVKRENFYSVPGYPTTWFDGTVDFVGAITNDTQMYNAYWSIVSGRLGVATDVTVDLDFVLRDADSIDVTTTVTVDADGIARLLKAHIVQVIDYFPSSGDNRYRNCVMSAGGMNLPLLNPGESFGFTKTFDLDPDSIANIDEVEFVAFARKQGASGPQEVYNSAQTGLDPWPFYIEGDVDRDRDVDLGDLAALLGAYGKCEGEEGYEPHADFNPDQCIDLGDLAALLGNYGYTP